MLYRVTVTMAPHRLDDVVEVLNEAWVLQMTVFEGKGAGPVVGRRMYRGVSYLALADRTMVDVVVHEDRAAEVAKLMAVAARTDTSADGLVSITPLEHTIDVRSGAEDLRLD